MRRHQAARSAAHNTAPIRRVLSRKLHGRRSANPRITVFAMIVGRLPPGRNRFAPRPAQPGRTASFVRRRFQRMNLRAWRHRLRRGTTGAALTLALTMPNVACGAAAVGADTDDSMPTVGDAACRIIESAARESGVPVDLLTRLVWAESRFRTNVTSPAGAQGIAQFMPQTAVERGLADPFDPEQAIPKAAWLLVELGRRFGNFGLAAAAYNAGPSRVASWLAGSSGLPIETQVYVLAVTGRAAADWAAARAQPPSTAEPVDAQSCIAVTAALRGGPDTASIPLAPWGVQLAGNFSKAIALASFERARQRYPAILADLQPMIIGRVLRSRGTRPFYRVLVPAASLAEAKSLCRSVAAKGGACVALRT
jgi:hypothetical protein